jgi:hypothetical protein
MKKSHIITSKRGGFTPAPEGQQQLLRCYAYYQLGTHLNNFDKRQEKGIGYYEVCGSKMEDGRPFMVHKEYNENLYRSNLRRDIEGLIGHKLKEHEANGFDTALLLGKLGRADITHETSRSGNEYAKVGDILPVDPGTVAPPQFNVSVLYRLEDGMDEATLATLPALVQKKIRESDEFRGAPQPSKEDIARRNTATATENALAEDETDESDEADGADEPEVFDLDDYTDEDFRDPSVVTTIRKMIEDLPISNGEKINQFRRLNRLVHSAQANVLTDAAEGAGNKVPF